jgi:4-hydroxy-tetrahydrodipicolinate synthase
MGRNAPLSVSGRGWGRGLKRRFMLSAKNLKGVIPAIITPFTKRDKVDVKGLKVLTEHLIKNGVHAIMTVGGNGEFPHLLREEKKEVTAAAVEAASGRVPVIAGAAACGTKEAILLSQDAQEAGADGVIVTAPYYFRLPDSSLYQHYKTLAENIDLPVVVYNNPLYTGNNLSPSLVARLSEVKGIIGLKQSNDDLGQLVEAVRLAGDRIAIHTGIDSQFYPSLCTGANGVFSTAACVIPRQMVALYDAFLKGDHKKASRLHIKLQTLNKFLEYDPGYVTPCKEALNMMGLPAGHIRAPMPKLTTEQRKDLKDVLKGLGLI